jgi:hypothetical protein
MQVWFSPLNFQRFSLSNAENQHPMTLNGPKHLFLRFYFSRQSKFGLGSSELWLSVASWIVTTFHLQILGGDVGSNVILRWKPPADYAASQFEGPD